MVYFSRPAGQAADLAPRRQDVFPLEEITMHRFLKKCDPYLYALMRIITGVLFACHGAQKLFGVLGGVGEQPGATVTLFSLMGLAGVIELVGGSLIAFGWFIRVSAFIASGHMAAAYFIAHAPRGFWPLQNGGELAVIYCFVFLYIAAQGANAWSLDRLRHRSQG
jgi:putative oxidoreductase